MSNCKKRILRYSLSFKLHVVEQIELGNLSITQAQKMYGITGGQTIQRWLGALGKNHLLNKIVRIQTVDEKDQLKAMQQELKRLKEALADAHMEKRILETVIEEANKTYKTDLKKNFGNQPSEDSQGNTP